MKHILPTDYPSIGVPWLVEALTALYGKAKVAERVPQLANVTISNVPGPPVPLYLAGGRMVCNYPTSIVMHGIALNITVESYDQQMDFGLMADGRAMPNVRALADALLIAFEDFCLLEVAGAAVPAPSAASSLAQAGRDVAGGARKRVASGLGSMGSIGQRVGNAVTGAVVGAVGDLIGSAVAAAVRGAVAPRKRAARPPAAVSKAAPTAAPAKRRAAR